MKHMLSRRPTHRPLVRALRAGLSVPDATSDQRGLTLLSLMLGMAITLSVAAVTYRIYQTVHAREQTMGEEQALGEMINNLSRGYGAAGSFSGVSDAMAIEDGMVPPSLIRGNQIVNAWGGLISLSSQTINGRIAAGLVVTDPQVPDAACANLVSNLTPSQWQVSVNGHIVPTAAAGGSLVGVSPATAATMCQGGTNTIVLVHDANALGAPVQAALAQPTSSQADYPTFTPPHLASGGSVGQPPTTVVVAPATPPAFAPAPTPPGYGFQPAPACTLPTPAVQSQSAACPTGESGAITQQRSASCTSGGGYAWTPWTATFSSCAPTCVTPAQHTFNRFSSCPSGTLTAAGTTTFSQYETTTYSCASPSGPLLPHNSAWTPSAATACAVACTVPPSTVQTRGYACPSGQVTSSDASSFTQTRTKSYACTTPTGSASASYSSWSPTSASVCAPACVAPPAKSQTNTGTCPSGQVTSSGSSTFPQSRTETYTCSSPTGSPTKSYSTWSPAASSVCAAACVARPPVSLSQTIACPSGQATATAQTSFTQTATRSYSCPSPTGALQASTSPWSPAGSVACAHVYLPRQGQSGGMFCQSTGLAWAQMVEAMPRVQCPAGYTVMVKGLSCPYGPSPGAWYVAGNVATGNCSLSPSAIRIMNLFNHVHQVACPAPVPYSTGATWTAGCFK